MACPIRAMQLELLSPAPCNPGTRSLFYTPSICGSIGSVPNLPLVTTLACCSPSQPKRHGVQVVLDAKASSFVFFSNRSIISPSRSHCIHPLIYHLEHPAVAQVVLDEKTGEWGDTLEVKIGAFGLRKDEGSW